MSLASTTIDGHRVAAVVHAPGIDVPSTPLVVAVHGGTYTHTYFEVAGGAAGSFVDIATRNGFTTLTVDRPGYGGSDPLDDTANTFERQAEMIAAAVTDMIDIERGVVLIGHSIGGMVALEMAARRPGWLLGVAVSGVGARLHPGGAAAALGELPLSGVVDLPVEKRDAAMLGPRETVDPAALPAIHAAYAPVPFVELQMAPRWAAERLPVVAPQVEVPVHHVVARHDILWDADDDAVTEFRDRFAPGQVRAGRRPDAGHSLDHHRVGAGLHLEQLGFAYECGVTRGLEKDA